MLHLAVLIVKSRLKVGFSSHVFIKVIRSPAFARARDQEPIIIETHLEATQSVNPITMGRSRGRRRINRRRLQSGTLVKILLVVLREHVLYVYRTYTKMTKTILPGNLAPTAAEMRQPDSVADSPCRCSTKRCPDSKFLRPTDWTSVAMTNSLHPNNDIQIASICKGGRQRNGYL